MRNKLIIALILVFSVVAFAGNSWSAVSLPTANISGDVLTTATDLSFDLYLSRTNYLDGISFAIANGPDESIINAEMVITGATRTGPLTFGNGTLEIKNPLDSFVYFSATLNNIVFEELYPGVYYLNLGLDSDNPTSLNISDVVLTSDVSHPSRFIEELQIELGTNDVLGLKLGFYISGGDITGVGTGTIFDGLLDGVNGPTNEPPIADAGVTFNQDQCLGTSCEVTLDGRGSTDLDGYEDIVSFEWYEDINNPGTLDPEELIATGDLASVSLPLGFHTITLRVVDAAGETDVTDITVVIDPAELSFIDITKATVFWNYDWIKIKGKLALPAGVSHESVNSIGSATISLSGGLGDVVSESIDFEERRNGKKWRYHSHTAGAGQLHKFKIDWYGDKFNYHKDHMRIKSHHFGDDTTTLEIEFCSKFAGPVDVTIGSVTISIDADDSVSVTGATEYDVDVNGHRTEIEVVMPFNMITDLTSFDISGTITDTVTIADYYTAAVGRFKIKAPFDSLGIDPETIDPKELTLDVRLGDEGFSGILVIDNDTWTKTNHNKWKYRAGH